MPLFICLTKRPNNANQNCRQMCTQRHLVFHYMEEPRRPCNTPTVEPYRHRLISPTLPNCTSDIHQPSFLLAMRFTIHTISFFLVPQKAQEQSLLASFVIFQHSDIPFPCSSVDFQRYGAVSNWPILEPHHLY